MSKQAWMIVVLVASASFRPLFAQDDVNDLQEKAQKAAVARVAPSIVQIETTGGTEVIQAGPKGGQIRKGVGPTTGVIVSPDGYIISSAFNFANKPTAIFVTVPGHEERYVAKAIATDQSRMLALLKIEVGGLPVPVAVPKKELQIGQWAMALGRTLEKPDDRKLEAPPSISVGIISALERIWGRAIQTDAKVSPVNYGGPLIDIQGRIQGILVPASPREEGETAGVEWYDSGIGFAIPLEDILAVLPRLKEGKDLKKGLLGITVQGADQFEGRPKIATIQPNSAAQKAGIQAGDVVKAIDGKAVLSQAQLLHRLGTKYEGDTISITIERSGKEVQLDKVVLGSSSTSVQPPFLGILPVRDDPAASEEVRFVYPKSPAEAAGIKPGDRISKIGVGAGPPRTFSGRDQFAALLSTLQPGTEVKLELTRKDGGKTETVTAKLDTLPDSVPTKLTGPATAKKALAPRQAAGPAPKGKAKEEPKEEPKEVKKADKPETGLLKRRNAANDHDYFVYVPDNYDANVSHALVLWLHPVGKGRDQDFKDFALTWKDLCADHHLIVVAPVAENENGWISSETDAVVQCLQEVMNQYTVDRQRVIAHGMGIGGQMAFYLGFSARDLVRGVATTGAVLASPVKENLANQRLQFYLIAGGKDPLAKDIQESADKLRAGKFSVVHREIADMGHQYLDAPTLEELARWIDSLDRQ